MHAQHKILFKAAKGYLFKALDEILYLKAADKYAVMHSVDGSTETVFHSLAELEVKLNCGERHSAYFFYRVHRQYIAAIHRAERWPENNHIVLEGGDKIPLSRQRSEALRREFWVVGASIESTNTQK